MNMEVHFLIGKGFIIFLFLIYTFPSFTTQQANVAPICKLRVLPSLRSPLDRDYEVVCSWTDNQVNRAHFERSTGEIIDVDIKFHDHIISRVNTRSASNISCRLSLNTNPSLFINTPCIEDGIPRLVRVDPFIGEVDVGSTVVFNCTFNDRGRKLSLFWKVNSNGNASLANVEQKHNHPLVTLVVHEHEGKHYLLVECHIQLSFMYNYDNMSSYGALRVVEGTTPKLPTKPSEGQTGAITDNRPLGITEELSMDRNTDFETQAGHIIEVIEIQPRIEVTAPKLSINFSQIPDKRADEFTTDQINSITNQPTAPSKKGILVTVVVSVVIALIIIFLSGVIIKSFLQNKRKVKRKISRNLNRARTNLAEKIPSNILNVIQTRDLNIGDHSETEAQNSGEPSLPTSSDSHQYSSKIYRSDNISFSTVLESDRDLEPNCDPQTSQGSCQMETDLKEVYQKASHLEVQGFEPFYETIRDEVFTLNTCEGKPKTSVHSRLMTSSSRPDEKQQELKDTAVEQKTSNSSSSVVHWIVDPVDLHSRPLPKCPNNPITVQYDYLPSALGAVAKDEILSYEEINKVPAVSHIASQGFDIEDKGEGGTGTFVEAKEAAVQTSFAEIVLNDENLECPVVISKSLRSSRMDEMLNLQQCNEIYVEMKAKSDDPSYLDNSYLQDIQSPVFDLSPMCMYKKDP